MEKNKKEELIDIVTQIRQNGRKIEGMIDNLIEFSKSITIHKKSEEINEWRVNAIKYLNLILRENGNSFVKFNKLLDIELERVKEEEIDSVINEDEMKKVLLDINNNIKKKLDTIVKEPYTVHRWDHTKDANTGIPCVHIEVKTPSGIKPYTIDLGGKR